MTKDEIINHIQFEIYDIGYKNGLENFSKYQKSLFYYIDFTIYVDNGGISGFLYNKSPSKSTENEFLPYVACFVFFNFHTLADLIELYQKKYIAILMKYEQNRSLIFNDFYNESGLFDLAQKIEKEVTTIRTSEQIENWIFDNRIKLLKEQ